MDCIFTDFFFFKSYFHYYDMHSEIRTFKKFVKMHTIEIETEHQVKKVEQHGNNPGADDKPAVLELTTIKHNDDKDTPVVTKP